jgi:hypothetical protein
MNMSNEETRALRCYSVNELLLAFVKTRVKAEAETMLAAGASIQRVNDVLPDIISHWDTWRSEALRKLMREYDDIV